MKNTKVVKMIAIVMIMVMMLSTSVFAAGNEGVAPASANAYEERTFTLNYCIGNCGLDTITFTASCEYELYVPDGSDYIYFSETKFPEQIDLDSHSLIVMTAEYSVAGGDGITNYMDYSVFGGADLIRVTITSDGMGGVELDAYVL